MYPGVLAADVATLRDDVVGIDGNLTTAAMAKALEELGVAAVTLHGRTKVQMYGGTANWDYIREMKQKSSQWTAVLQYMPWEQAEKFIR